MAVEVRGIVQFLLMEYIPRDMQSFLESLASPIDWPTFKSLAKDVLAGLLHLQHYHVVHFDMKPKNVLVEAHTTESGNASYRAVLCDFGSARFCSSDVIPVK